MLNATHVWASTTESTTTTEAPTCVDTPGWEDVDEYSCSDFVDLKWCANCDAGSAWNHEEWGHPSDYGALENCCASCGCGIVGEYLFFFICFPPSQSGYLRKDWRRLTRKLPPLSPQKLHQFPCSFKEIWNKIFVRKIWQFFDNNFCIPSV